MGNNWPGTTGNSSSNIRIQNFLETLRSSNFRQNSANKSEFLPGKNIFEEIRAKKEIEKRRIDQFHQERNAEWNKVFSSKEIQTQKKIELVRQQIQQLANQLKRLDTNIQKTVSAPISEYGDYQESFLDHLRNRLRLYSLNVSRANSWLEVYQNRSRKQGMYWHMAGSKGSSYTQNNERSIATSVG